MGEGRRKRRRATPLREAGMGHRRGESSTKARGPVLGEGPGLVAVGGFRVALGDGTSISTPPLQAAALLHHQGQAD